MKNKNKIKEESKNKRAEKLVGLREEYYPKNAMPFDQPCELGYHCPICKYRLLVKGNYDERLEWSEYQGFLWCSVCNFDFPSFLCIPNLNTLEGNKKATEVFLNIIEESIKRSKKK